MYFYGKKIFYHANGFGSTVCGANNRWGVFKGAGGGHSLFAAAHVCVVGGAAAVALGGGRFTYLLLGLLGVPVFAGGGGLSYVLQPSFGYIPGFLAAAVAVSLITRCGKPGLLKNLLANACGVGLVYLFGLSYYFCLNTFYFGRVVALSKMLLYCWVIFIPSDVIALVLTAFLGQKLRRFVPQKG